MPEPTTPDPLADLREPDAATLPGGAVVSVLIAPDAEGDDTAATVIRPMVPPDTHDEMVSEAVAGLHADPSALGFLHGGGQCGCRYIARLALLAAVPIQADADEMDQELEPSSE